MKDKLKRGACTFLLSAFGAVSGILLFQKYQIYNMQKQAALLPPPPQVDQYEIDLDKIQKLKDVIALVKVQLPEKPIFNVRHDSLEDSKKLEGIRGILKNQMPVPQPMKKFNQVKK